MVLTETQYDICPVCLEQSENVSARYRDCVCEPCLNRFGTLDEDGLALTFGNVDFTGGFVSMRNGVRTSQPEHVCYVNGIKCFADEARFGGIVIQKMNDNN